MTAKSNKTVTATKITDEDTVIPGINYSRIKPQLPLTAVLQPKLSMIKIHSLTTRLDKIESKGNGAIPEDFS